MADFDLIICGGGHNALIAAGYLAKSGQRVLVLERRQNVGGGSISEEITLPGFLHNTHSAFHRFVPDLPWRDTPARRPFHLHASRSDGLGPEGLRPAGPFRPKASWPAEPIRPRASGSDGTRSEDRIPRRHD